MAKKRRGKSFSKELKNFGSKLEFWHFFPVLIIILVIFVIFFVSYETNCGDDQECFMNAAESCKMARVDVDKENNIFSYRITGSNGDSCLVEVTVIQTKSDPREEGLFLGKSMLCNIPKEDLGQYLVSEIPNLIDYCSGELKEAMYEFIIDKMYGVIAQNLGEIISDIKDNV
tara:strand:+ start:7949 stop:8464 length:516 start_codon:yes stop_codon:yes gene_type:complete